MKIYEYNDCRKFLRAWLKDQQKMQKDLTFAQIASDIGMQRPAFSKALKGDSNFSSDQIYSLALRLKLNEEESQYLELLAEQERTGIQARKKSIQAKIRAVQKMKVLTPSYIDSVEERFINQQDRMKYFTNPWAAIVHIFLTIPEYQNAPQKIQKELQISEIEFKEILNLLERIELIRPLKDGKWLATENSVHSQDMSSLPQVQLTLFRAVSMHRLSALPLSERFGLSVAFSADENVYEEIRQILVKTIQNIHEKVGNAPAERVYQLSIDLFPWSQNKS